MKRGVKRYYMHTLDGKPALYGGWHGEPYIAFAGGTTPAVLCDSLRQIRREQRLTMLNAIREGGNLLEWGNSKRYGYVLVELPEGK